MKETSRRTKKVISLIQSELANLVRLELNDPRIAKVGFITISGIKLSPDHKSAIVFVSFMGKTADTKDVQAAIKALNKSKGFLHHQLLRRMEMKVIPNLQFKYDPIFDQADKINFALEKAQQMDQQTQAKL